MMKLTGKRLVWLGSATLLAWATACGAGKSSTLGGDDDGSSKGGANVGGSTGTFEPTGGSGNDPNACNAGPDEDRDGDGITKAAGDCNDCDININPNAVEVVTDATDPDAQATDEDCDGMVDELEVCDQGLSATESDPFKAAQAIDLCKVSTGTDWGVIDAQFVRANGTPTTAGDNVGLLPAFGSNVQPRLGDALLALSSGHARTPSDPNPCNDYSCYMAGLGSAPPGFPQDVPNCTGDTEINDDIALEVSLRAPSNATGYSFDFSFYSFEYPEWVCTSFNDQFIALVSPPPMGSINGNISFDSMSNPVSVNIAFFEVCSGCPLGDGELQGTGFDIWDDAGATSWLVTQAPIAGGEEVSVRFAIWDTGDQAWDSTVLIDNFQWIANAGSIPVGTKPVPN